MTGRERLIHTLSFGDPPDRIFYRFGNPRKATLEAWYLQGLPRMTDAGDYGCPPEFHDFIGSDAKEWTGLPINLKILPPFETCVLEETEHGRIWRDGKGIVMHDAGDKLTTPGFNTRSYISHPVKNREDWSEMRKRYDPSTPGRYPQDWNQQVEKYRNHEYPISSTIPGLFFQCRDWVGFENLCLLFYDDPALVHEMMEHVTVFSMEVLHCALHEVEVDLVIFSEDMAYKHAAMISPAMFHEFVLLRYKRLASFFKEHGVPLVMVDTDGHVGQLIPLWIEAGIAGTTPLEIAAHNDPVAYRRQYGRNIVFMGGIDKREIRSKEHTFIEVMRKVPWLVEQGGYLPGFDHAVPPDVPLRSYLYVCELIKAIAEGRPVPAPNKPLEIEEKLGPIQRMWGPDLGADHN